jgi:hypothetical protein
VWGTDYSRERQNSVRPNGRASQLRMASSAERLRKLGGGSFKSGFLAAGFSSAAAPLGPAPRTNPWRGVAFHALVGGTGSVLGGGKFADGAVTGAFRYLFNDSYDRVRTHIRLLGYRETLLGHKHAFLWVFDDNNVGFIARGQPSQFYPGGAIGAAADIAYPGVNLEARVDPTTESPERGYIRGRSLDEVVSTSTDESLSSIRGRVETYTDRVNGANIPYRPQTTNSNAYSFGAYGVASGQSAPTPSDYPGAGVPVP